MVKLLNYLLDVLLFIVPILELTEVVTFIPTEYLPWYMLASVILRRLMRMLEEKLRGPSA